MKKNNVMIIDDDMELNHNLSELLKEAGFEVCNAHTGDEAFLLLESFTPDIVLLDISMPKMNGYEVCKTLKHHEQTRKVPVLFLTGMTRDTSSQLQSLMVGGVDFITKPFELTELIDKINFHLLSKKD